MSKDIKVMLKEAGAILIITLIAGLLLGFVYQLTLNPRQYQEQLAAESLKLGKKILNQLHKRIGLTNQGKTLRYSSQTKYPNGAAADYYGIIRQATEYNMMSMIVEHAFVDNDEDYEMALSTKAKLKKVGVADAIGIAKYYGLSKKM